MNGFGNGSRRRRHTDPVTTRYADLVGAQRTAVFDGTGAVDAALRRAAGTGAGLLDPWAAYVAKVRDASYRITDDDVDAATGAALYRLDLGLRAMNREP